MNPMCFISIYRGYIEITYGILVELLAIISKISCQVRLIGVNNVALSTSRAVVGRTGWTGLAQSEYVGVQYGSHLFGLLSKYLLKKNKRGDNLCACAIYGARDLGFF